METEPTIRGPWRASCGSTGTAPLGFPAPSAEWLATVSERSRPPKAEEAPAWPLCALRIAGGCEVTEVTSGGGPGRGQGQCPLQLKARHTVARA